VSPSSCLRPSVGRPKPPVRSAVLTTGYASTEDAACLVGLLWRRRQDGQPDQRRPQLCHFDRTFLSSDLPVPSCHPRGPGLTLRRLRMTQAGPAMNFCQGAVALPMVRAVRRSEWPARRRAAAGIRRACRRQASSLQAADRQEAGPRAADPHALGQAPRIQAPCRQPHPQPPRLQALHPQVHHRQAPTHPPSRRHRSEEVA
jgi:hypothetical protein